MDRQFQLRSTAVISSRLRVVFYVVLVLFGVLAINSLYLAGVSVIEAVTGEIHQGLAYQFAFLAHLALGLLFLVPFILFGVLHLRKGWSHPNRNAARAGLALFIISLVLVISGLLLTRALVEIRDPRLREVLYWAHIVTPVLGVWLFLLHRLAGPRIRWRVGLITGGVGVLVTLGFVVGTASPTTAAGNATLAEYLPAQTRLVGADALEADVLMNDQYCLECHPDTHEQWSHSVHKFSSFNNPAYKFSVLDTQRKLLERDGHARALTFCAGCHDPVPMLSGALTDAGFDQSSPSVNAGITCTVCHAVTDVHNALGNGSFTIEAPVHYPFADSEQPMLKWINHQLIKAKPAFHKKMFLKPLHQSPEFCGACHKVHLPEELNDYKWLRGQNHYDTYHLSGVSGHGVSSFYYPPKAQENCNTCHMPSMVSADFGARPMDDSGALKIHDHQFPGSNTAIPHMLGFPDWVNQANQEFLEGVARVDIFAVRDGPTLSSPLIAPVRPTHPELAPGQTYLIDVVLRTLTLGHPMTQGTADSNELWVDVTVRCGDRVIGRSGGLRDEDLQVDPWSHFVNAYVIDRDGNRIDRRNAEDIFVALYNNQIPPGAGDVLHYQLNVPEWADAPITFEATLRYRKFDAKYMRLILGEDFVRNELPITTIASDRVVFPLKGSGAANSEREIPMWQRWNDYGIGLLRKGSGGAQKGELRQAEFAFQQVEALGRPDGPLNLARVYMREGRLADAAAALERAAVTDPPGYVWTRLWLGGELNRQLGSLDPALDAYKRLIELDTEDTRRRGFDFSQDYRLLNAYAGTLFERAKLERGDAAAARRNELLAQARTWHERALVYDAENATALYGLAQIASAQGDTEAAQRYSSLHSKYKVDDNARDRAVSIARSASASADYAAEPIVIYDLQRDGAYDFDDTED